MKAWLITWIWIGDHAAVDTPLIAVLSARLKTRRIQEFIEQYHVAVLASPREQIEYAQYNNPRELPYRAEVNQGRIICGHNPFICGRLVESLKILGDDRLMWIENGRPRSLAFKSDSIGQHSATTPDGRYDDA